MNLIEIIKTAESRGFFELIKRNKLTLKKPSEIILNNIKVEWLNNILQRTKNKFKVYLCNKPLEKLNINIYTPPVGFVQFQNAIIHKQKFDQMFSSENQICLKFTAKLQREDAMKFFLQWQRFRKMWWSTITSTPSLFMISDINYEPEKTSVSINAQLPWYKEPVETIVLNQTEGDCSTLSSSINLDFALIAIMADGLICLKDDDTLKLHRKIAPFKFSFAFECGNSQAKDLFDIATLINIRLNKNALYTKDPMLQDTKVCVDDIFSASCKLGVPYTIVLGDEVLKSGIFELLNRDTKIREQVHVSFFDKYAMQLFKNY